MSLPRKRGVAYVAVLIQADGKGLLRPQYSSGASRKFCLPIPPFPAQIITLVDLAGHTKYFKTTASGLTGHLPDYAAVVIGANAGVIGMCKEHLGVALALQIPTFFVVTKVSHVIPWDRWWQLVSPRSPAELHPANLPMFFQGHQHRSAMVRGECLAALASTCLRCKDHPPATLLDTKVDLAPAHVAKHSLETLTTILKHPSIRKKPFMVRDE